MKNKLEQLYNALKNNQPDIATRLLEAPEVLPSLIAKNELGSVLYIALQNKFPDIAMRLLENPEVIQALIKNNSLCTILEVVLKNDYFTKREPWTAMYAGDSQFATMIALYEQSKKAENDMVLKEFAYLESMETDMTGLMQEITHIHETFTWVQSDKPGPQDIKTPIKEIKFASPSEILKHIQSILKDSPDMYFSTKGKHLSLFIVEAAHIPELLREKTANPNTSFVPDAGLVNKAPSQKLKPLDKFPDSAPTLINKGYAHYLRNAEDYTFLVHAFETGENILKEWKTYLEQGLTGFMHHAPFFSASVINPTTPYANMQHQGNQLPAMALVIQAQKDNIIYANGCDIFSESENQYDEKYILSNLLWHLEKRKIVELTIAAIIKHALKQELLHIKLFKNNWELIVSRYFPNLILPFDETFSGRILAQPQISAKEVLRKTTHNHYNEVVLKGNGMSAGVPSMQVSAILVQEDLLNEFFAKMTNIADDKEREQLLANFNQVLSLGLPLIVIKIEPLLNLKKGLPPTEKDIDALKKAETELGAKTTGLYFALQNVQNTPATNKDAREFINNLKAEIGKNVLKLREIEKATRNSLRAKL